MMNKPITLYIIDDEFPKIKEFIEKSVYNSAINSTDLFHLAITQEWKGLQPLQQLIKDIITSQSYIDGMLNVFGFTRPTQALDEIENGSSPDVIVYDWEYEMPKPKESQEWLLEILSKTDAMVFVYSQVRDQLPEFLNKKVFDQYADRFQLFLKGSADNFIFSSEEFILQYAVSRVSSNHQIKVQGIEINFSSNGYLKDPSDILYLENILGRKFLLDEMKELNYSVTQDTIEQLIGKTNGILLFNQTKQILLTKESFLTKQFNGNIEITYLDALKKFGLNKLQEVLEIGFVKI